jgi:hypothetical protein
VGGDGDAFRGRVDREASFQATSAHPAIQESETISVICNDSGTFPPVEVGPGVQDVHKSWVTCGQSVTYAQRSPVRAPVRREL